MGGESRWDRGRQAANVVGALFQVVMTAAAGAAIQDAVNSGPPSLVEPAAYAFGIWGVIFVLSLAYAAYQVLPANRESPLLRRIGWLTAGAFFCTGLWSVFVTFREFSLAQLMLLGIFGFLLVAYLRLVRSERRALGVADRWLVALPIAPFFGWVTAANAVSLTSEAVRSGLVAGGAGEALLGSALLLAGSGLAAAVVLAGKNGPAHAYLVYGATVLWALIGVIVNQYDASLVTTSASVVSAVVVALALVGGRRVNGS